MHKYLLPILSQSLSAADERAGKHIADNGISLACHEGCDFCCFLRVDIAPHEAMAIAEYIVDHFSKTEIASTVDRLRSHVAAVSRMTPQQHQTTNIRCPLLVDSQCSVYPVRPLRCRGHTSLDVRSCEYSFNNPLDEDERRPSNHELDLLWAEEYLNHVVLAQQNGLGAPRELGESLLPAIESRLSHQGSS